MTHRDEPRWYERTVRVTSHLGIHAKPALDISQYASNYKGRIHLSHHEVVADATSIMQLMMLQALKGAEVKIQIEHTQENRHEEVMSRIIGMLGSP